MNPSRFLKSLVLFLAALLFIGNSKVESAILLERSRTVQTAGSPKSVAMNPDGNYAAVANLEGGDIRIFDTQTKKVIRRIQFIRTPGTGYDYQNERPIPSFQEKPVECIFSPDGRYLFASLHNAGGIIVYDMKEEDRVFPSTKKVVVKNYISGIRQEREIPFIKTGTTPKVLTFSPDGKCLYVSNWHSGNVSAIDAGSLGKTYDIPGMKTPRGMCCSCEGKYLIIANEDADFLSVLNLRDRSITDTILVGKGPRHIIPGIESETVFVSLTSDGYVAKVNVAERRVDGMAKVGRSPRTIALTSNGQYLFAADYYDNTVSVVDTRKMKRIGCYRAGVHPCGLCISPDNKELWVTNYISNTITIFKIVGNADGGSRGERTSRKSVTGSEPMQGQKRASH